MMECRECAGCNEKFSVTPDSPQQYHASACKEGNHTGKAIVIKPAVMVQMEITEIGPPDKEARYEHFMSSASRFPTRDAS